MTKPKINFPVPRATSARPEEEGRKNDGSAGSIVLISKRFVALSLVLSALVAFAVGRTARMILLVNPQQRLLDSRLHKGLVGQSANGGRGAVMMELPNPVLKTGKFSPSTEYTSKSFATTQSASTQSRWAVMEPGKQQCVDLPDHDCPDESASKPSHHLEGGSHMKAKGESHLPQGQHLLMDLENVNEAFLNSEERLAHAMLELVGDCGLTLLSYHCHKMNPMGVSCAGVLLESHVSFHTWPREGVITLDLFTCGPKSLLPIVPLAEKLFAIPRDSAKEGDDEVANPNLVWAYKNRGFADDAADEDVAESQDMGYFPIGKMTDYKKEIVSITTKFQRIDIYDVLRPLYQSLDAFQKSLQKGASYESLHPELFNADRIVFLDGVMQSRRSGDAAYHEVLVHPPMFAHRFPKRVAIIGGGEGATLREVLKHKTVEKVMMIDIDEMMVKVSREFLPSWSDCSTLVGSAASCFDDARVEMHYIDAFKWFIDTFPENKVSSEEPFDVIIMDALDPQIRKDFVDALYADGPFLQSLPNALGIEGIFIAQLGETSTLLTPAEEVSYVNQNRVTFVKSLAKRGFESVLTYLDGGHSGFSRPWQYLVAFKDFDTRSDWFSNSALVSKKIRERTLPTIDGSSPFLYFDGPTMLTYQYPSKQSEVVFCRGNPHVKECKEGHGFNPERQNLPLSSLEVKQSSLGERAGRGVFAKVDIPSQSYVGLEKLIPIIYGSPQTYNLMANWEYYNETIYDFYRGDELEVYTHGYGHVFSHHGRNDVYVDSTFHCFINHACGAKNNVGHNLTVSEASADPETVSEEILDLYRGIDVIFNPAKERQVHYYSSAIPLRDIKKGEELFDNYVGMSGRTAPYWKETILGLTEQCEGTGVGVVREYDVMHSEIDPITR